MCGLCGPGWYICAALLNVSKLVMFSLCDKSVHCESMRVNDRLPVDRPLPI